MGEKRGVERKPFEKKISYMVSVLELRELKNLSLMADIMDISDSGLGMHTDYPLEPGHVLRFDNGIGRRIGVVRWSVKNGDNKTYRAGVSFK